MIHPKIRIDDVLQFGRFSSSQLNAFAIRSPFEWFKIATLGWEDYPLILAVIADGIDEYPEWVRFIKYHPQWRVECHGWDHRDYRKTSVAEGTKLLIEARKKIEDAFECEVHEFYPPWMKHNETTKAQAEFAGLTEVIEEALPNKWLLDNKVPNFYFHYWSQKHIEEMNNICHLLHAKI